MGVLKEGKWLAENIKIKPEEENLSFTGKITAGAGKFKAEPDRYHLYISYACPFSARAFILRSLKGLEDTISMSVFHPVMAENGWQFGGFPGSTDDKINKVKYLWELYVKAKPDATGKTSIPVLWDKKENTIVSNDSIEIMRMLDTEFYEFASDKTSFYPEELSKEIEQIIKEIHPSVNQGVYEVGQAKSQKEYDKAFDKLFDSLEHWEEHLFGKEYLCGNRLTEADICFFNTLYRFDPVYYLQFKCNLKRISDYTNLDRYLKRLYSNPKIKETCNMNHIKEFYYRSPQFTRGNEIVPKGPLSELE